MRGNKLFGCLEHGIVVCGAVGEGCIIEENEIVGCQLAGIDVSKAAAPSVSHNIVERGAGSGIHVHDGTPISKKKKVTPT